MCNTLGEYRYQADVAACRHADGVGDHVFNTSVDGVLLHGPTDWFYGDSLRVVEEADVKVSKHVPQAKSLDIVEISVQHFLLKHGREFAKAVNRLPTGGSNQLGGWATACNMREGHESRIATNASAIGEDTGGPVRDIQSAYLLEPLGIEHGLVQMRHRICRLDAAGAE